MQETRRNLMVALFVSLGLAALAWLVLQFGDLPLLVHRMDSRTVTIYFPQAMGIQQNSEVYFCGYRVGYVLRVEPPRMLAELDHPERQSYQIVVHAAFDAEHHIPRNITPKIVQSGLSSSYIQFDLYEAASTQMLSGGEVLQGIVYPGGQFIPEAMQQKINALADSLTRLSTQLGSQLEPLPPELVDRSDPNRVRANLTTVVMRLDRTCEHLDRIVGDPDNRRLIKESLARFAELTETGRLTIQEIQDLVRDARTLLADGRRTVGRIDGAVENAGQDVHETAVHIQTAADEFARALQGLDALIKSVSQGSGTASLLLNDPRLYEALTDTLGTLKLAIEEFRQQITVWKERGILYKEN
ncbi:MAG: MCE family protein [Sedimentisphaerales bacterium]|nr:MCE family protein [Sedimentisphaerales bacterium]